MTHLGSGVCVGADEGGVDESMVYMNVVTLHTATT